MINQNLKILHTASFFLAELTVLYIIILQSLLAPYQLLLYKKVYFYNNCYGLPHVLLIEQIHTHIPYFYFAFSVLCKVQSSSAIDKK